MATSVFVSRVMTPKGLRLVPADAGSERALRDITVKPHEVLRADIVRDRSHKHNRWFHALLSVVCDAMPEDWSYDDLRNAIKVRCGYVKRMRIAGKEHEIPDSLSFANCDQQRFNEFVKRAEYVVMTEIMPGVAVEDLRREINEFFKPKEMAK